MSLATVIRDVQGELALKNRVRARYWQGLDVPGLAVLFQMPAGEVEAMLFTRVAK